MAIRGWLWRGALAAVVLLAVPVLVVKWRVAVTLDRWVEQAQPFARVTRGRSFVGFDGDIGVDQVSVTPNAERGGTLRAERITLHTPGLWWLLRAGVFDTDVLPSRFGVSIDGLDTSLLEVANDAPTLIGTDSGAAFDHAGCQDEVFTDSELIELGLPRAPARLFARYSIAADGALRAESGVERADSASSILSARLRLAGSAKADAAALMGASLEGFELALRDAGFVALRNKACSERLKVDVDTFLAAHLAKAQRIALALGLSPDSAWWESYAQFARDGGALVLSGAPRRPIPLLALQQASGPGGALLLDWQVRRDDATSRRTEIAFVTPQPLGGKPLSLAAQLEQEMQAQRMQQQAAADAARSPEVAAAVPEVGVVAPPAEPPATPAVAVVAAPAAPAAPGSWVDIDYAALGTHIGSSLRVETAYGSIREGTLERWNAAGMTLRLGARDGGIALSLSPRDARSIRVRDAAPAPAPQ
jgi:hypothetical protein